MNILDQIPFLKRNQSSSPAGGKFVIAHWDRDTVSYLIATSTQRPLRDNEFGLLSLIPPSPADSAGSTPEEPKRLPPLVVLASHLEEQGITVNRLAVLLSRPELDQLSLSLPPASQDELPRLVLSEVEQQQGEVADPPVVDYLIINENAGALPPEEKGGGTGPQVLAFALSQRQLELLQQEASTAGFKLIAIGSRQLAPLRLLPREGISSGGLAISIHLLSGEAEVAICRGREPVLLR